MKPFDALRGESGFSVVELMLWASMVAGLSGIVANLAIVPTKVKGLVDQMIFQQAPVQALDSLVREIKEADSTRFPFTSINQSQGGTMDWFRHANMAGNQPYTYYYYVFENAGGSSLGSLVRYMNLQAPQIATAVRTVILSQVLPPDPSVPLFQKDPTRDDILLIRVQQIAPNGKKVLGLRRVAIRN